MNKGLEALEELKFQVGNITYYTKDLQATAIQVRDSGLFEIIEKELKVLEIIKEKRVDVYLLVLAIKRCKDKALNYYNCSIPTQQLTKKEFDLLKEVIFSGTKY